MGRSWKKRKHQPQVQPSKNPATQGMAIELQAERFAGPLPHPEILAKYNQVEPGFANRIVAMAESQTAHRQALEKAVINGNIRNEARGQVLGFIICMTIVTGSFALIWNGFKLEGLAGIITSLVALAGVFIWGRTKKDRELAGKRRQLEESARVQ